MTRIIVALVLAGCGGSRSEPVEPAPVASGQPDLAANLSQQEPESPCHDATTKAMLPLQELTKTHARPLLAKDLEVLENDCLSFKYEAQLKDPDVMCLHDAKDDAAIRACVTTSLAHPRDKAEAKVVLERAATAATALVRRNGALPRGDIFATPAIACCARVGHKCRGGYGGTIWESLGFDAEFTSYFQLAYQSDGAKLAIKAVGDLDCDGTTITYTLEGSVQGNEVRYKIVAPTNPD